MGLTPTCKISVGSQDITRQIKKRLLSVTVTDHAGLHADSLELLLNDKDQNLQLPETGTELSLSLGYKQTSLEQLGRYIIDEIELSGPPNQVIIRGKGVDMSSNLKQPKTRTWQKPSKTSERISLQEILSFIANEHQLQPKLSQEFADLDYAVVNQTNEHDLNLLTRLATHIGGIVKPTKQYLLLIKKGAAQTASGKPLPVITLQPSDVSTWKISLTKRGCFQQVIATYLDLKQAKTHQVTIGQGEPSYQIRKLFKDRDQALNAANAQLAALTKGTSTLDMRILGDPSLMAESRLQLVNFRDPVNGHWVIDSICHSFTNNGYYADIRASPFH